MITRGKPTYSALICKRKRCVRCSGLANPSQVDHGCWDSSEIGPWTRWQGDLDADLMVVGQDWGDVNYFRTWRGKDQPSGNTTNENLRKLLSSIGFEIGTPGAPAAGCGVFLTNLILCLKDDGLQAPIDDSWLTNCARLYFVRLVEIIQPRAIAILGLRPSLAALRCFGIKLPTSTSLSALMQRGPFANRDGTTLFPVYHCGARGVNMNRPLEHQMRDWAKIAAALEHRVAQ